MNVSGGNGGQRMEVARNLPAVAVRDLKDPRAWVLEFTADAWRPFTAAVKAGKSGWAAVFRAPAGRARTASPPK